MLSDLPFESVINGFVYAVLAFVQRGNHAQSQCTETVIVLLGHCDTAGVGGVFFLAVKAKHFVEMYTGMVTNRFNPIGKYSKEAC